MPYQPPPDLGGLTLAELVAAARAHPGAPVDRWAPDHTGDSRMRIAADGTWYHEGGPITRPAMVRAFSALLRREADGTHVLVTPAERLTIAVDDAAFIATDMAVRHDEMGRAVLAFRLNSDDIVLAGPDHPLRVAGTPDLPAFYLSVRHGTEARLNRSTSGQLIEHALEQSEADDLSVESGGIMFSLVPGA